MSSFPENQSEGGVTMFDSGLPVYFSDAELDAAIADARNRVIYADHTPGIVGAVVAAATEVTAAISHLATDIEARGIEQVMPRLKRRIGNDGDIGLQIHDKFIILEVTHMMPVDVGKRTHRQYL